MTPRRSLGNKRGGWCNERCLARVARWWNAWCRHDQHSGLFFIEIIDAKATRISEARIEAANQLYRAELNLRQKEIESHLAEIDKNKKSIIEAERSVAVARSSVVASVDDIQRSVNAINNAKTTAEAAKSVAEAAHAAARGIVELSLENIARQIASNPPALDYLRSAAVPNVSSITASTRWTILDPRDRAPFNEACEHRWFVRAAVFGGTGPFGIQDNHPFMMYATGVQSYSLVSDVYVHYSIAASDKSKMRRQDGKEFELDKIERRCIFLN